MQVSELSRREHSTSRLCSVHHDILVTIHTPAAYGQWCLTTMVTTGGWSPAYGQWSPGQDAVTAHHAWDGQSSGSHSEELQRLTFGWFVGLQYWQAVRVHTLHLHNWYDTSYKPGNFVGSAAICTPDCGLNVSLVFCSRFFFHLVSLL